MLFTLDRILHSVDLEEDTKSPTSLSIQPRLIFLQSGNGILSVPESRDGEDINEDGDALDIVAHVVDLASDMVTSLNLAVAPSPYMDEASVLRISDDWAVFTVSEKSQGGRDLNGDEDAEDVVLHVHDFARNDTTNLRLNNAFEFSISGDWLAFTVMEEFQGGQDLNEDGNIDDWVMHVHNLRMGTTTNLAASVGSSTAACGKHIVYAIAESLQGEGDLNGDGDAKDVVVNVLNLESDEVTNLGLHAPEFLLCSEDALLFHVGEESQGGRDLNGDGDTMDRNVAHVFDFASGKTTNLALSAPLSIGVVSRSWVAVTVQESQQGGQDLNGDGDAQDFVVHVHDVRTGTTNNTGLEQGSTPMISGGKLVVAVREHMQGGRDLNDDGDASDAVLHEFDLASRSTIMLGAVGDARLGFIDDRQVLANGWLAYCLSEFSEGGGDLNGDGDLQDLVLHVRELQTGISTNLELSVSLGIGHFCGTHFAFTVPESAQGDLNNDGDTQDFVLHVADLGSSVPSFVRGDCNRDGKVNIADAIWCLNDLFRGGPDTICLAAGDANSDGKYNPADAMFIIMHQLLKGEAPPSPYPECGSGGSDDRVLGCERPPPSCAAGD